MGITTSFPMRWRPCGQDKGPWIVVAQADLTTATMNAIVSSTDPLLFNCGGMAAAIAVKGGREIQDDCKWWIQQHKGLPVGHAISTRLKKLQHKFGPTFVATIRKNKLYATCPRQRHARIENDLRKHIRAVEPESVVIQLPEHVSMGKLIGKNGQQIAGLRECVEELLSSEDCGAGHEHVRSQVLAVDTAQKTITVTLQGASKPMMSVVVSRVQSIMDMLGAERLPLTLDASGERGQQMQKCPRLAQLLNPTPPTAWKPRDEVMLQLAHALVWKGNASIHGGFLRDWVVRGEEANDIDVQLAPPSTTEASIEEWLTTFLAETPGAAAKALTISNKRMKGAAVALTINGNGIETPIDVDLVDRKNLTTVAPPGVDCDAGNLLLNRSESLRKKIQSVDGSLGAALDNTMQKRFVFFYPLESGRHQGMSVMRLKRYLARGWTCLSEVPPSVQTQFLTENERALICPASNGP